MQFVFMIYQGTTPLPDTDAWSSLSPDEQKPIYADYAALNETPNLTTGLPLGLPENAKTVRVHNGRRVTSDGPYFDANGAGGGYSIFEADDLDAAIELAHPRRKTRRGHRGAARSQHIGSGVHGRA